jgi:hypothetical protein
VTTCIPFPVWSICSVGSASLAAVGTPYDWVTNHSLGAALHIIPPSDMFGLYTATAVARGEISSSDTQPIAAHTAYSIFSNSSAENPCRRPYGEKKKIEGRRDCRSKTFLLVLPVRKMPQHIVDCRYRRQGTLSYSLLLLAWLTPRVLKCTSIPIWRLA